MRIRVFWEPGLTDSGMDEVFSFLIREGLAPDGATVLFAGVAVEHLPPSFTGTPDDGGDVDLEIAFLNENRGHNEALLHGAKVSKLLVGRRGLPSRVAYVCVPFESRRFQAKWMHAVLTEARRLSWKARLVHGDHGWVAHEIVKVAEWFHLDEVKAALSQWLTEETRASVQNLIQAFPGTDIQTRVGGLAKILKKENPRTTLILGSLSAKVHLPHRHHGIPYGAILTKTGTSAYLLVS